MKRDVFGGGQPCGLAAASAWGRRPPKAGGGPTKYHQLAFSMLFASNWYMPFFIVGLTFHLWALSHSEVFSEVLPYSVGAQM
jgi:hypothetical protein